MKRRAPFDAADLEELDLHIFSPAAQVVAMQEVHDGNRSPAVVGLRHDLDAGHALATGVKIAAWEAARGYRATYYVLHTSPYWHYPEFRDSLDEIAGYGHEIGIHTNALAEALRTGKDPDVILEKAIGRLRAWGFTIRGVAGHGDPFCNRDRAEGEITFANDEQFVECARPGEGEPDRTITRGNISLTLNPRPLADFGLEYEALKAAYPFPFRISDSGGRWLNPGFEETVLKLQTQRGVTEVPAAASDPRQLHFLWHPDWWSQAFVSEAIAA